MIRYYPSAATIEVEFTYTTMEEDCSFINELLHYEYLVDYDVEFGVAVVFFEKPSDAVMRHLGNEYNIIEGGEQNVTR